MFNALFNFEIKIIRPIHAFYYTEFEYAFSP